MSDGSNPSFARLRARMDVGLTVLFLGALVAPTVDEYLRSPEARGPQKTELREPARRPVFFADPRTIKHFAGEYEDWYLDSFGLRDKLLRWGSIERLFLFGVSPTDSIVMGKDDWMFYTGNASARIFRGRLPLSQGELAAWQVMLENHTEVCSTLGAEHLIVIGPNKETIYPEFAPPQWTKAGPTRLEQLADWLKAHAAKTNLLDLRPALVAEKAHDAPGDHVYFELGTHWNGRGVYTAYRSILAALAHRYPSLAPLEREQFRRMIGADHGDTWARAMYVDDLVPQQNHLFVARSVSFTEHEENGVRLWIAEGPDPSLPRAVMFHDSFGQSIMFQLAPHFSRLACYWTSDVSDTVIEREKPDVVLEVFVERYLANLIPQDHMIGRGDLSRMVFDRSRTVLYTLTPNNAAGLAAHGAARVEPMAADGLARVTLSDASGWIEVPRFSLAGNGDLLVRLDLETAEPGEIVVLPMWKGEHAPRRKQFATNRFGAGASTVYVRIPRTERLDGLALRFAVDQGAFVLRGLEVRGMPGQ